MTISSTVRKAGPYVGNGSATSFPFAFKVFLTSDVVATLATIATGVETTLTLNSDYTVTLNADQNTNPGGTVTYNPSSTPMPSTKTLTLTSSVAESQGTEIPNAGGFYPEVVENALDKVTVLVQQVSEVLSRCFRLPVSSTMSATLPLPTGGSAIGWNAAGTALINIALSTGTALASLAASTGAALIGWIQAGAGAVLCTVQDALRENVSANQFGADPSGATDSTAAIQAAFLSFSGTGGVVNLSRGTYAINDTLVTGGKNIILKGQGKQNTRIVSSAVGSAKHGIEVTLGTKYLVLRDLTIDPSAAHTTDHGQCAVRCDLSAIGSPASDVEVLLGNVSSTGWNNGLYATGCSAVTDPQLASVRVIGCDIKTQGASTASISDPVSIHHAKLAIVEDNVLDNDSLGDHCVYMIQNANIHVRKNLFKNSEGGAVKVITNNVASQLAPVLWDVSGNTFDNVKAAGSITIDGGYTLPLLTVTDNVVTTDGGGGTDNASILLSVSNNSTVRNAIFDGCSFIDIQKSAIGVNVGAGSTVERFSAQDLNIYNWSVASAGAHYALFDGGTGTYKMAVVSGYFNGNSNGKAPFNLSTFTSLFKGPCIEINTTVPAYQGGIVPVGLTRVVKNASALLYQNANVNQATSGGTGEETLGSTALTANTLAETGQAIRIKAWGAVAANANTKTIRVKVGATTIQANNVTTAPNGVNWNTEAIVFRTSGSFMAYSSDMKVGSAGQLPVTAASTALDWTSSVTVAITGQNGSASAGDITLQGWSIEYLP